MTPKERAAMQQALEALEEYRDTQMIKAPRRAITALRETLAGVNMSPTEQALIQQALEHKRSCAYKRIDQNPSECTCGVTKALTALREALDQDIDCPCNSECIKCSPRVLLAEQERKYGELAGTHNWTPPNYTDEQWQKLDQEYQNHVAEQALQKLSDFHQSIEHDGHWSDCSTHNEPAYPNGECDCGGYPPKHWRCACGANLYIDSNGAPASKAEQEPECKYKEAYIIWQDKTEWVQETAQPKELGMHRADVLRQRIENLQNAATHPVRTKDLTDDEVAKAIAPFQHEFIATGRTTMNFARAVIAADRSKNGII